jgi:hypothetical protein
MDHQSTLADVFIEAQREHKNVKVTFVGSAAPVDGPVRTVGNDFVAIGAIIIPFTAIATVAIA